MIVLVQFNVRPDHWSSGIFIFQYRKKEHKLKWRDRKSIDIVRNDIYFDKGYNYIKITLEET